MQKTLGFLKKAQNDKLGNKIQFFRIQLIDGHCKYKKKYFEQHPLYLSH